MKHNVIMCYSLMTLHFVIFCRDILLTRGRYHNTIRTSVKTYRHFKDVSADTCSNMGSRARCKLLVESLASKQANTTVFCSELGCLMLAIWKSILKELPPLSPPTLIQTSSLGITPLCHVKLLFL